MIHAQMITGDTDDHHYSVGIVAAKWNSFITDKLLEGALDVLQRKGLEKQQLCVVKCPGAFEIPFTSKTLLPKVDGIITLGAVIRGQTPHFDYVCRAVTDGVLTLNMNHQKPVVFGVLTTETVEQAHQRADASSDYGNKGAECALALLEMLALKQEINQL